MNFVRSLATSTTLQENAQAIGLWLSKHYGLARVPWYDYTDIMIQRVEDHFYVRLETWQALHIFLAAYPPFLFWDPHSRQFSCPYLDPSPAWCITVRIWTDPLFRKLLCILGRILSSRWSIRHNHSRCPGISTPALLYIPECFGTSRQTLVLSEQYNEQSTGLTLLHSRSLFVTKARQASLCFPRSWTTITRRISCHLCWKSASFCWSGMIRISYGPRAMLASRLIRPWHFPCTPCVFFEAQVT